MWHLSNGFFSVFVLFLTIYHSLVFLLLLFCHSGECGDWKSWHQPRLVLDPQQGICQLGLYPLYVLSSQSSVVWSPCASEGARLCKIWCVHKVGHLITWMLYIVREQLISIVLKLQVPTVSHTAQWKAEFTVSTVARCRLNQSRFGWLYQNWERLGCLEGRIESTKEGMRKSHLH